MHASIRRFTSMVVLFMLLPGMAASTVQSGPAQNEFIYLPVVTGPPWTGYEGWVISYDDVIMRDVVESADGRFVAVGRHQMASYPGLVFMVDSEGVPLWAKLHQLGQYGIFNDVHLTAGGDIIAVGVSVSYEGIPVVRHQADGTLTWQRWIDVPNLDRVASTLTSDGGLILAGGELYKSFVWRLDANGALLWQKALGDSGNNTLNAVIQLNDGTFVAAGQTTSAGAGDWDGWLVKLDAAGNAVWQKSYGTIAAEQITDIQATPDGGFIVAGGTGFYGYGAGWVMKLNGAGEPEWSKAFSRLDTSSLTDVLVTNDGRYLLSGVSVINSPYQAEGWQVSLAADGAVLWQHGLGTTQIYGPLGETADGGLVMAGFWGLLLRLNGEGYVLDCPLIHSAAGTVNDLPVTVSVYPYGPGPASHTLGGTWFHTDLTLVFNTLCPQNVAKCAPALR